MLKLYPSAIDFSMGGACISDYESGCWRWLLFTQGVKNDIDPIYKAVGALHEDWHHQRLKDQGHEVEAEVPFKLNFGEAQISGRCDFLLKHRIDETKSTLDDKKVWSSPQRGHLAQLCIYLTHFEKSNGLLVYGGYAFDSYMKEWVQTSQADVKVEIKNHDAIHVNGTKTEWSIGDLVGTVAQLTKHHADNTVPDRPLQSGFKHACKYCPAAESCNKYEQGKLTDEQLRVDIRVAAENKKPFKAKFKTLKGPKT